MASESDKAPQPLFRWVNVDPSQPDLIAVTVPEAYKHLSRKELGEKHPEVVNAMKAATLDLLWERDMLTDFFYLFADLKMKESLGEWEYADLRRFTADEIKELRDLEQRRRLEVKARLEKNQKEHAAREELYQKMRNKALQDSHFAAKLEKLMEE
jgi:hypothetical protein